jgi:hypothetical protein
MPPCCGGENIKNEAFKASAKETNTPEAQQLFQRQICCL